MIGLHLPAGELQVLCLGAHPDDIEIGCGGTLLTLASRRALTVTNLVLTGSDARRSEARRAAGQFCPGAELDVRFAQLTDGQLPAEWREVKQTLESLATSVHPDVIFAPRADDAHQDHRTLAELVPTVWRDCLILGYEIPKWDGDLSRSTVLIPISEEVARLKISLLHKCFPSQTSRDWWDDETFRGLMRLRGVECRTTYAEAFALAKATISP